ncbi:hypothetical protein K9L05_02425, partial [Candidatus Babeliales bacterium]|nr:hypothetical protein [Candidatus Babeliales bacterium]
IEVLKSLENLVKEYVKQSNTFWQRLSVAGKIWQKGPEFLTWRLWHNFDQVSSWKKFENLIITTSVFPFKLAYKSILKISKCIFNVTKRATSTAYEKVVSKKIFKLIMLYVALCAAEVAFEYKHVNDIRFSDIQHLDLEKLKAFCEKIYLGFGNGSNNLFLKKNFEKLITRLSHPNFKNVHEAFAPYFKKIYNAIYGLITGHEPVGCKSKACEQIESLKSWFISDTSFVKIAVMYMIFKDMVL